MDRISQEQRRKTMRAVKSKNSIIEQKLRKALWRKGYRYRVHYAKLVGKPDIVLLGPKIAIFCDSEFWHGFDWEHRKHDIKSNRDFWFPKIERNIERDKQVTQELQRNGWKVLRIWGNEIKDHLDSCIRLIEESIIEERKSKL